MKVAFIGLGVMGFPMAGHLQAAGHEVTVYNRSPDKAAAWAAAHGGSSATSPREAASGAQLAALCVGNDDDVRSVVYGEQGALAGLAGGAILVDHTTASAELARELEAATGSAGVGFLDAPVSGGQAGAENAVLTVMVGGEESTFKRAKPVLQAYARCAQRLGPAGSGQLAKMVNQVCIAGIVQSLSEGLLLARKAGLDPKAVVEVISQGAAQSWQMNNRYESMLADEYEHGFAVDWMRKDLGMVLTQAEQLGIELPVARQVDNYYEEVQSMGGGRWDTSSLFARMEKLAGDAS